MACGFHAGCGPFLYQPPSVHRRAHSDVGAERLRRSASPPRTARGLGLGYGLGYGAGTAAREVHERLYYNANEIRARKEEQRRLQCVPGVHCKATFGCKRASSISCCSPLLAVPCWPW